MTQEKDAENTAVPIPEMPDDSPGFQLAERACYHILERKGDDVVILDLRGLSDVCDFFVLATGQADVQVKAIASSVRRGLLETGQKPAGSEGEGPGRWILLDYVDVVVHALKPEVREYYQLERLWADARTLAVDPQYLRSDGFRRRHPDLAAADARIPDPGPASSAPPAPTE